MTPPASAPAAGDSTWKSRLANLIPSNVLESAVEIPRNYAASHVIATILAKWFRNVAGASVIQNNIIVESSSSSNANDVCRIELHNLELEPWLVDGGENIVTLVTGSIEELQLEWQWASPGGSSVAAAWQDMTVKLRGVHLNLEVTAKSKHRHATYNRKSNTAHDEDDDQRHCTSDSSCTSSTHNARTTSWRREMHEKTQRDTAADGGFASHGRLFSLLLHRALLDCNNDSGGIDSTPANIPANILMEDVRISVRIMVVSSDIDDEHLYSSRSKTTNDTGDHCEATDDRDVLVIEADSVKFSSQSLRQVEVSNESSTRYTCSATPNVEESSTSPEATELTYEDQQTISAPGVTLYMTSSSDEEDRSVIIKAMTCITARWTPHRIENECRWDWLQCGLEIEISDETNAPSNNSSSTLSKQMRHRQQHNIHGNERAQSPLLQLHLRSRFMRFVQALSRFVNPERGVDVTEISGEQRYHVGNTTPLGDRDVGELASRNRSRLPPTNTATVVRNDEKIEVAPVSDDCHEPPNNAIDSDNRAFLKLSMPCMQIVLHLEENPPATIGVFDPIVSITLPSCRLHHHFDASESCLIGAEGVFEIQAAGNPISLLLELDDGASWRVDLLRTYGADSFQQQPTRKKNRISISLQQHQGCGKDNAVARRMGEIGTLRVQKGALEHLRRVLYASFWRLSLPIKTRSNMGSRRREDEVAIHIDGVLQVELRDELGDWIQAELDSLDILFAKTPLDDDDDVIVLSTLKVQAARLGPTSLGDASVEVPPLVFANDELYVENLVAVKLESKHLAFRICSFVRALLTLNDLETKTVGKRFDVMRSESDQTSILYALSPFKIKVAEVRIELKEPCSTAFRISDIHVDTRSNISCSAVEAKLGFEDDWIVVASGQTSLSSIFTSLTLSSMRIGPASFGDLSIKTDAAVQIGFSQNQASVTTAGIVHAWLGSLEVVIRLMKFAAVTTSCDLSPEKGKPFTFASAIDALGGRLSVEVPEFMLKLSSPLLRLNARGVHFRDSHAFFEELFVQNDNSGLSSSAANMTVSFVPGVLIEAETVTTLDIPGVYRLSESADSFVASVSSDGVLRLALRAATLTKSTHCVRRLLESTKSGESAIPFPIHCSIPVVHVVPSSEDVAGTTDIIGLTLVLKEMDTDLFCASSSIGGIGFGLNFESAENNLLKMLNARVSGIVQTNGSTVNTVSNFLLEPNSVTVAAGFSSVDWSTMYAKHNARESVVDADMWSLPYARITPFEAHLSYKDKILATNSSLVIPRFCGSSTTTSEDIALHVTTVVLKDVLSFYSNADFLGERVVDMTAKSVGRLALRSSVLGTVSGSVGGLLMIDAVQGIVALGKERRGVAEEAKYRFDDLPCGIIRALQTAAYKGRLIRVKHDGNNGRSYRYISDIVVGTSSVMGDYVQDNRSRLGSAGGAGVGMLLGSMVFGPVGFFVGSIVGGKAGLVVVSPKQECADKCSSSVEGNVLVLDGDSCLSGADSRKVPSRKVNEEEGETGNSTSEIGVEVKVFDESFLSDGEYVVVDY